MASKINLENITNGLLTIQRLKQVYKSSDQEENREEIGSISADRLSLLQETLTSIKDFFPETRGGGSFNQAFQQGSRYSSAYRGIKQHVRGMDINKLDGAQLLKGMKLVVPILNNQQRVYMDKVVRIFDILQS